MMVHRHRHHVYSDYTILSLVLMVGFFSFLKLTGSPDRQALVGLITALAYVGWGVFHHMHEGDLHWKIVVEYGSLAVFGFATLYALLMFAN